MEQVEIQQPNEIPEELQREILSWLPSKSLSRFNSVSKHWLYSFTSSAFLLRHSRSPTPTNLFFSLSHLIQSPPFQDLPIHQPHHNTYQFVDDDDMNDPGFYEDDDTSYMGLPTNKGFRISLTNLPPGYHDRRIVGVSNFCDGMLCFFTGGNYLPSLSMLLYSVRTHEFVLLPTKSASEMPKNGGLDYVYVACMIMCCLGFDPVAKEYKSLRVISGDDGVNEFEVLTIGSSKYWRSLKDDDDVVIPHSLVQGVPHEGSFCLDGMVYWVNESSDKSYVNIVIGSFDLSRQVFRVFEMNKLVGRSYNYKNQYYLTSCKGCATLICIDIEGGGGTFVLSLNQQNGVWTRTFDIPTPNLGSNFWFSDYQYVGGKIMVRRVDSSFKFHCYDVENANQWCIQVVDGLPNANVVEIRNNFECYADSSA